MRPSEQDRALDALVRAGRFDPSDADLKRLERTLGPWLDAQPAPARDGSQSGALKSIFVLVTLAFLFPSDARNETPPTEARPAMAAHSPSMAVGPKAEARASTPSADSSMSVADLPNAPVIAPVKIAAPLPRPKIVSAPPEGTSILEQAPPRQPDESEAAFLHRAQLTLATDPAGALQLLQEHPTRFPRGGLVQERDVMMIDSLVRLGRTSEARARAAEFAAHYPRSAHGSRITSILKEGSR